MSLLAYLADAVEDASRSLPAVTRKRMFGCDAWFAAGSIYALVWKHGRVALKLPDPAAFAELMALPGAEPWAPGAMKMSGWVMVPEGFHDDGELLRGWTEQAHRMALAAPPKKTAPKKTAPKKAAPKKAPPKRAAAKNAASPAKQASSAASGKKAPATRPARPKRPASA